MAWQWRGLVVVVVVVVVVGEECRRMSKMFTMSGADMGSRASGRVSKTVDGERNKEAFGMRMILDIVILNLWPSLVGPFNNLGSLPSPRCHPSSHLPSSPSSPFFEEGWLPLSQTLPVSAPCKANFLF